jgi:hypothetical protein
VTSGALRKTQSGALDWRLTLTFHSAIFRYPTPLASMAIDNASISTDDAGIELPALLEKMAVSEDLEEMRTRISS